MGTRNRALADNMKIIVFTPGEVAAEAYSGYLTDRALTGSIAKAVGGAVVMVERKPPQSSTDTSRWTRLTQSRP